MERPTSPLSLLASRIHRGTEVVDRDCVRLQILTDLILNGVLDNYVLGATVLFDDAAVVVVTNDAVQARRFKNILDEGIDISLPRIVDVFGVCWL